MVVQSRGLRDKYCIAGVGETEYSRASGRTTRAMAVEAIRHPRRRAYRGRRGRDARLPGRRLDARQQRRLRPRIRFNFYMDVMGGGSSTEALVGLAMGAIEAGMCNTVAIYRSMNGYSEFAVPARASSRSAAWTWRRCPTGCAAPARTSRRPSCAT